MTAFKVGDILQPLIHFMPDDERERTSCYYLVKRITIDDRYDVENIGNGEKLYGMRMQHYEKIP